MSEPQLQYRLFNSVKTIVHKLAPDQYKEYDGGTHIALESDGFWCSVDEREITLGVGVHHVHFDPNHDELKYITWSLQNLLTCKSRTTTFTKGKTIFKQKLEVELPDGDLWHFDTMHILIFPFWRKTFVQVEHHSPILSSEDFERNFDL